MARRSWNNAAPKGSFMHQGMAVHAASIGTGNKSSKACQPLITVIGPIVYSYWTSLTTVTGSHTGGVFVIIISIYKQKTNMRNAIGTPYTGLTEDQRDDLRTQFYDLINSLEYNVDKSDLIDAIRTNLMWFEMD